MLTFFEVSGRKGALKHSNARPLPPGVAACGVLWVRPGDPMTRRPISIVLIKVWVTA